MSASVDSRRARSLDACRTEALEAIDAALEKPHDRAERAAVAVTQRLVVLRDVLIEARRTQRSDALDRELARINAALSLVHGVQFPLEGVQWDKLKKVREEIAKLPCANAP